MPRYVILGLPGSDMAPESFPSVESARRWLRRTYSNNNPMHVTQPDETEVKLTRLGPTTYRLEGEWIGEPTTLQIVRRRPRAPEQHHVQLRLV